MKILKLLSEIVGALIGIVLTVSVWIAFLLVLIGMPIALIYSVVVFLSWLFGGNS